MDLRDGQLETYFYECEQLTADQPFKKYERIGLPTKEREEMQVVVGPVVAAGNCESNSWRLIIKDAGEVQSCRRNG
jgi:hypothetical protein